jgi:hypothetical protein
MDKVLWAEELTENSGEYEVVVFTRSGRLGDTDFYRIAKRRPMSGEKKIIEKELAALH